MIDRIANEMLIAKEVLHTNSIDAIATELNYAPLLILNALYEGERSGKLVYHRKSKTIDTTEDVEVKDLAITDEFFSVGNDEIDLPAQVEQLIRNLNSDQTDMSIEELSTWLPGMPVVKLRMMVYLNPNLTSYELLDPKDRKSAYTFITLQENATKLWGQKQFDTKKSRVAKRAQDAVKRAKK